MGKSKRNQLKISSVMIIEIIIFQIITSTYGSPLVPESNFNTPSKISTILSQNISKHVTIEDQEIKTILHQFNEVEDDFKRLETIFDLQSIEYKSRKIRSTGKPQECPISKDELTILKNQIETQLSLVSNDSNLSTCPLNSNDLDGCKQTIKLIHCGFKNLKDAASSGFDSIEKIKKWNYVYGNLFGMYKKLNEYLKQILTQEYQLELGKIYTDFRQGKERLFIFVNQLEIALDRLRYAVLNICVAEIMDGEYEEAADNLRAFKLTSVPISTIIKESYHARNGTDDLENFESILNFIERQQTGIEDKVPNDIIAYETLYNQMELNNHLNSSKVTLLARAIENSPAKDNLTSLYSKVEDHLPESQIKSRKARFRSMIILQDCKTTKDVLTFMKMAFERQLTLATNGSNSSTCPLNLNDLDFCKATIKLIQCGFNHLKDADSSGFDSIEKILKWNYVYGNLFGMYEEVSAYSKQKLLQEYQPELDKLQVDLRQGKEKLFLFVNQLELALERLQYAAIDISVWEIMVGEHEEAADNLRAFKLLSLPISTIIKESYHVQNGTDDFDNFENILNFVERQQTGIEDKVPNDVIAYKTLYNEMELNNHLNSSKVILLARAIENSPAKDNLTSLYSKVDDHLNKIKISWANVIYNNGHDEEYKIFDNNIMWYHYFPELFSDIFKKATKMPNALTDNFDNILQFISNKVRFFENTGIALSAVFNEIKRQGVLDNFAAMPKLAYMVKQEMDHPSYPNLNDKVKKMYEDVKLNTPSWAYQLIWQSDKCKLRNRNLDQYLYVAGEELAYDEQRRRVFSGQESFLKGNTEAESQWKFETEDKGESFMIKIHRHWNEYLYAYKDYSRNDGKPLQVFTGKVLVRERPWKITPTGNGTYVTIQNIIRNEYLYVDNVDENNKLKSRVFARKLGTPNNKESLTSSDEWELKCDVNTKN